MNNNSNLSTQLLKSVLFIYFTITILVTLIHFSIEYSYTKNHIKDELQIVAETFQPALQTALWDLNSEQIESITNGMMNMPLVYGVIIRDPNNTEIIRKIDPTLSSNEFKEKDLLHTFNIHQKYNENNIFLAKVTIYSDDYAIFNRLKIGFTMIMLNAFIKSTALIILFILAFKKYLEQPLKELTKKVSSLNWHSREHRKININFKNKNELHLLLQKFNELLSNISSEEDKRFELMHNLNQKLELEVESRTKELQEANEKLKKLATTDLLTQLNNRVILDNELQLKFDTFKRHERVFSLIMMDVDFFKSINDKYGHIVGDSVLKEIASLLKENIRSIDIAGRWGGEEFLIICDETNLDGAYILAENIRVKIQNHKFAHANQVTASLGVAMIKKEININELIKNADDALYQAKRSGRNKSIKANL